MGKRKELLTEFLSFFIGESIPLPIEHPDGVRRILGDVVFLPRWHPDGVRRLFKTVSRLGIAFLGALFEFEFTETKRDTC